MKLVTLKALLTSTALATLDPDEAYRFCLDAVCEVVYFTSKCEYGQVDVKVPVFQKNQTASTPVCYCFGHTRANLETATRNQQADAIPPQSRRTSKPAGAGVNGTTPRAAAASGTSTAR
ncbi:hypothetical protein GCM10008955_30370 [Deinococcus malanensis]|uniref:CopZ zinc binding domain-containing protein n=1 Tax=Deinococcus malanensis TaxID=1706855 RepID=A0ABQ2F016_9DEIO|nr:hypothetical protein GCM10008955_30370 [Deinococcus malanensis]